MRLKKTQEIDPYANRSSEAPLAHERVQSHYPDVKLQDWGHEDSDAPPTRTAGSGRRAVRGE